MSDIHLEEYFDVNGPDDIRVRGTRVGIETILDDYMTGVSPEEIAARYRTLTLEQVYATITYYLHNRTEVDAYLDRWRTYTDHAWENQSQESIDFANELRPRIGKMRELVLAEKSLPYWTTDQR